MPFSSRRRPLMALPEEAASPSELRPEAGKPLRVAARFRPAAIAVEYVAVSESSSSSEPRRRLAKRVYEMHVEDLVCAKVTAEVAVSFVLRNPAWPKELDQSRISRTQLERLYNRIQEARSKEDISASSKGVPSNSVNDVSPRARSGRVSSAESASEAGALEAEDIPELRASCEPELRFKVSPAMRDAAARRYQGLGSSADDLMLSCTGDVLPRHLRLSVDREATVVKVSVFDEDEGDEMLFDGCL